MPFCHSYHLEHLFLTNPWDNTRYPCSFFFFSEPVTEELQILANINQLTPGSYDIFLRSITGKQARGEVELSTVASVVEVSLGKHTVWRSMAVFGQTVLGPESGCALTV